MKEVKIIILLACILFLTSCKNTPANSSTEHETIYSGSNSNYSEDSAIYNDIMRIKDFTHADIENVDEIDTKNSDYYANLVKQLYDLPYWKAMGTGCLAFDIQPSKTEEEVVSFIDSRSHEGFETLFDAFFWNRYSDNETIEYAKSYAYYLSEYILNTYSFDEFVRNDYRKEWLDKVCSKSDYSFDSYDLQLENADITYEKGRYSIKVGDNTWICGGETWVNDASQLYKLIHNSQRDFDLVKNDMEKDAPDWFNAWGQNRYAEIELYNNSNDSSYCIPISYGGKIFLCTEWAAVHEYVHAISCRNMSPDSQWIAEGVAEYYSLPYYNPSNSDSVMALVKGASEDDYLNNYTPEKKEYFLSHIREVKRLFEIIKEKYGDNYDDSIYCYWATGQEEIAAGDLSIRYSISDILIQSFGNYSFQNHVESNLSYNGASVTCAALIEEFGAEEVLSFLYTGGNFKSRFGCTIDAFRSKLRESGDFYDVFINSD